MSDPRMFTFQDPAPDEWNVPRPVTRTALPKKSGLERPSVQNSWRNWRENSRRTDTWLRKEDSSSRGIWVWTRPKSRSGSRTRGRRSRRPLGRRTLLHCSWWLRDSTITPPFPSTRMARRSTPVKISSRKSRGIEKTSEKSCSPRRFLLAGEMDDNSADDAIAEDSQSARRSTCTKMEAGLWGLEL